MLNVYVPTRDDNVSAIYLPRNIKNANERRIPRNKYEDVFGAHQKTRTNLIKKSIKYGGKCE